MLPLRFSGRPFLDHVFLFPSKHATVITALSLSLSLGVFFLSWSLPNPTCPEAYSGAHRAPREEAWGRATAGRGQTQAPGLVGLSLSAGSTGLGEQNVWVSPG